jgi:C4-dicarboxylate-specific signal transduction histidine kinase
MMRLEWRGIELKLNTIVDKAFVTGNAASLLQVLQAIIENAEEAMDVAASHPKKLMIKIWHEESDVLIRIIDSGSGLQIGGGLSPLSPFVTTKSREGHAGLGLTQARDLIDEMNGSLTINAEKAGFGLGVLLRLPLLEGDGA